MLFARAEIFHKEADYEAFVRILSEGLERYDVELSAFQLMPNHWHLVLHAAQDGASGFGLQTADVRVTLRRVFHWASVRVE